jgi:hypothetical protein
MQQSEQIQQRGTFNINVRMGNQRYKIECYIGITLEELNKRIKCAFGDSLRGPFVVISDSTMLETDTAVAQANLCEDHQLILTYTRVRKGNIVHASPYPSSSSSNSSVGNSMYSSFHHSTAPALVQNSYNSAEIIRLFNGFPVERLSNHPVLLNIKKLLTHCFNKGDQASFSLVLYATCKALMELNNDSLNDPRTILFMSMFPEYQIDIGKFKSFLETQIKSVFPNFDSESNFKENIEKLANHIKTGKPDEVISNEILEVMNSLLKKPSCTN